MDVPAETTRCHVTVLKERVACATKAWSFFAISIILSRWLQVNDHSAVGEVAAASTLKLHVILASIRCVMRC